MRAGPYFRRSNNGAYSCPYLECLDFFVRGQEYRPSFTLNISHLVLEKRFHSAAPNMDGFLLRSNPASF